MECETIGEGCPDEGEEDDDDKTQSGESSEEVIKAPHPLLSCEELGPQRCRFLNGSLHPVTRSRLFLGSVA